MVKFFTFLKIAILVIAGNIRLLAQENLQPDKDAIELLNATQSINHFADSINLISRPDQLPKVLSDYLLDWKITNGICRYVTPINFSFRKAILDRVVREDVLQWIVDSKNPAYDFLYDPVKLKEQNEVLTTKMYHHKAQGYCDLPFMKLSIRQLARVRLATLQARVELIDKIYECRDWVAHAFQVGYLTSPPLVLTIDGK